MSDEKTIEWFLQLDGEQYGPFPGWQISRYLLLQRLDNKSLVSRDGEHWTALKELPELQPQRRLGIADLPAEERERLEATTQWVLDHPELFKNGHDEEEEYTPQPLVRNQPSRVLAYGVVLLLAVAVLGVAYLVPSSNIVEVPQCEAVAAPGVNWSNCRMRGSYLAKRDLTGAVLRNANLSSSDLSDALLNQADIAYTNLALSELSGAQLKGAQLKGANLRNANLKNANLEGADLRYADLSGAILDGANFTNARLGYVVWEENLTCMPQSVGECIPAREGQ